MDEHRFPRKGSLIKAQQAPGREPCLPPTQDILRISKGATYLALHQTIYSSLKPFAGFINESEDRDLFGNASASKQIDGTYLNTIIEKGNRLSDEPSRKLYKSFYQRFQNYFLQHIELPELTGHPAHYQMRDNRAQEHQYQFQSLREPGKESSREGIPLQWPDPLKESLLHLYRRLITPWLEKQTMNSTMQSPLHHETGAYGYLSTLPDHPGTPPHSVVLLSEYEEIEESRLDDGQIRYILKPYNRTLENIEVFFDQSRNLFTVKGSGFTKSNRDGSKVHPQVIVDPETGCETRIYWLTEQSGYSLMELENYDTSGNLLMKSIEKIFDNGNKSLHEMLYESQILKESSLEVELKGNILINRHFSYRCRSGEKKPHTIDELSRLTISSLKRVEDLGLRDLREAAVIQELCRGKALQIEARAEWTRKGEDYAVSSRNISLRVPGGAEAVLDENHRDGYTLQSTIKNSSGQTVFQRTSAYDENKRSLTQSVTDRELNINWEHINLFARDGTPLSTHCVIRDPIEWEMKKGIGLSHLSVEKKVTHLLPGVVMYVFDSSFDTLTHKESTRHLHYFEKLIGSQWIKPSTIKKTSTGEIIVTFSYQSPADAAAAIEEQRSYIKKDDYIFETACSIRKRLPEEQLLEEMNMRRNIDTGEETIEILRNRKESQYQETTNIKGRQMDRFVRSQKKTDKVPLQFFPEANRWLDMIAPGTPGIQSRISTYIHEKIRTDVSPHSRTIIVREETYETELPSEQKRDTLNFLAFLDEDMQIHYRTRAHSVRTGTEKTLLWEDGELITHQETPPRQKLKRDMAPPPKSLGLSVKPLRS